MTDFTPRSMPFGLGILLLLLACAASMSTALGSREITHTMECVALTTAQEAWIARAEGDPYANYITYFDGRPRIQKPPLVAWLDWIAWIGLEPGSADVDALVLRARIVSVAMGLLTIACLGWIGRTLGDRRVGLIALAAAGSMVFLQRQARTASFDIHMAAWTTLAVAGGLWAMHACDRDRGEKPDDRTGARRRSVLGWTICAIGTLGGFMSKNPLAAIFVAIPLAGAILLAPGHAGRIRRFGQLLLSMTFAAALTSVWYVAVIRAFEGLDQALINELRQTRSDPQVFYYYAGLIGLVAPWSIWLVAGLVHPFTRSAADHRRLALVPWLWFVSVVVVMSIPGAKQQRYILPAIPPAALMIAFVWRNTERAAARGVTDAGMRIARTIHWIMLLVSGPLFAITIAMPDRLGAAISSLLGRNVEIDLGAAGWPLSMIVAVTLSAIAVFGWRAHRHWHMTRAALATAAWGLVTLAAFWVSYGGARSATDTERVVAQAFKARTDGGTVARLVWPGVRNEPMDDDFRFYFQRPIHRVHPAELADFLEREGPLYILAREIDQDANVMRDAGLTPDWPQQIGVVGTWRIWRPDE